VKIGEFVPMLAHWQALQQRPDGEEDVPVARYSVRMRMESKVGG
jgi:hypothetical protein